MDHRAGHVKQRKADRIGFHRGDRPVGRLRGQQAEGIKHLHANSQDGSFLLHQSQPVEELPQRLRVHIVLEIIAHRGTPHGQCHKDKKRENEHRTPRHIGEQPLQVVLHVHLLGRGRGDALLGRKAGHHEKHKTDHGKNSNRRQPALGIIGSRAATELVHQRQRQALHHELGHRGRHKANGSDARAFLNIARHHAAQRTVRCIIKRIERHEQHIGDTGVEGDQSLVLNAGIVKCQHIEHHERQSRPHDPRAELAPAGLRLVRQDAHRRIHEGIHDTGNQQHGARDGSFKPEYIRVKLQLVNHHHLEDEVRRRVAQRIADFFA